MGTHGGKRPGAGRPPTDPEGPRIRRTIYIAPETNHALEALANPGEKLGDTIDRIIRTRELYPAFTKTKPTLYEVLAHHWGDEEALKWLPPTSEEIDSQQKRTAYLVTQPDFKEQPVPPHAMTIEEYSEWLSTQT